MLSSFARAAIGRVVGASTKRAGRAFQHTWRASNKVATSSQLPRSLQRLYATKTAGSATKVGGKAAVKPRAKKASTAKKPVKKPVKKAKKAKKVVKAKKVLTPEQVERLEKRKVRLALRKEKDAIKQLKQDALLHDKSYPKLLPQTAYLIFYVEQYQDFFKGSKATEASKAIAAKYKALSPAELLSYAEKAVANKSKNAATHKAWIESHTPEQIRVANAARSTLNRKLERKQAFSKLQDERIPKRNSSAQALFFKERMQSGNFAGLSKGEAMTQIHNEFNALSDTERKVWDTKKEEDRQRYISEYKAAFQREPPSVLAEKKAAA